MKNNGKITNKLIIILIVVASIFAIYIKANAASTVGSASIGYTVNNNANILKQGNYEDIDNVLNYLVNDLKIMAKNIEKCPSIMYRNVSAIKYNYLFLNH